MENIEKPLMEHEAFQMFKLSRFIHKVLLNDYVNDL